MAKHIYNKFLVNFTVDWAGRENSYNGYNVDLPDYLPETFIAADLLTEKVAPLSEIVPTGLNSSYKKTNGNYPLVIPFGNYGYRCVMLGNYSHYERANATNYDLKKVPSNTPITFRYPLNYTKGSYIGDVVAENGAYPDDGVHTDGYWYVNAGLANQTPTISGTDQDLGGKTSPFNFSYTVDDKDTTQELAITEKLNGTVLRTISNALRNTEYQVQITEDRFSSLTLNTENTIEISVSDGQGATAFRRLKFRRTNSAPTISITNRELGEQNEPFSFTFTVNDLEKDTVNLEFINGGKIIDTMEDVTLGEEITYTFDKVTFAQLFNGNQEIVIRAIDINNAASADRVYFTKAVAGAGYIHKYQSDVLCDYVIVWDDIDLASGEVKKLQVCNNFNDENPAWEDAPFNDVHKFANTTVVNAPDVGVRIEVLENPNTGNSYINSFMVKAGVISGS